MHIKSLHLQNFRCFEEATFEFLPGFNLLIGENGAGKSSVLDAIKESLVEWNPTISSDTTFTAKKDIRIELSKNAKGNQWESKRPFSCKAIYDVVEYEDDTTTELESLTVIDGQVVFGLKKSGHSINTFFEKTFNKQEVTIPLNVVFRVDRLPTRGVSEVDVRLLIDKKNTITDGFVNSVDQKINIKEMVEWIVSKSLGRALGGFDHKINTIDDDLSVVRMAILSCVDGCESIYYVHNGGGLAISWEGGAIGTFDNLSDGQRLYIAMVADIARRACLINPRLGNKVLEETPGIVLIDELDLHLHPKWQRSIVANLTKTFPKIQFIATTHSPQIIGECKPEQVIIVTKKGGVRPPESFGMDSNAVLREIMGADDRDKEVSELIDKLFSEIDERKLTAARASLQKLRAKASNLAEIIEAEHLIERFSHDNPRAAE